MSSEANERNTESRLLYEIMGELGRHGAVYRCNSGSIRLPSGKYFHAMPKGFADLMLVLPGGRVCFIECKTDKGKPTPEQERFIARMNELGARAGIARSVRDAVQICGL